VNNRAEILKHLESWGAELAKAVVELKEPVMEIPARTLSNTIWDDKARILRLGPEKNTQKIP
jgi:DNA topoisomerase-6 subunit A